MADGDDPFDHWLDIVEAARELGIHPQSMRRLIKQQRLPARMYRGKYLIDRDQLQNLQGQLRPPPGPQNAPPACSSARTPLRHPRALYLGHPRALYLVIPAPCAYLRPSFACVGPERAERGDTRAGRGYDEREGRTLPPDLRGIHCDLRTPQ